MQVNLGTQPKNPGHLYEHGTHKRISFYTKHFLFNFIGLFSSTCLGFQVTMKFNKPVQ